MLYLSEPYLKQLQTNKTGEKRDDRGSWFAFEQTIFYPQGGGQSADRGWINGKEVLDVRRDGDTVWHLLNEKPEQNAGMKLDWDYRYENMRQHTGQHVLSACFSRLFNLETVSVHLGSENTLIELNTSGISAEQLQAAEEQANAIIAGNIPVKQMWIYRQDLGQYNLRRDIKVDDDPVRVIQIGEYDCTGCGGIHVHNTAEIGLIKITGTEKIRKHIRVHSKIGRSAYNYYSVLIEQTQRSCALLSMEVGQLPERIQALLNEQRDLNRQLKDMTDKWLKSYAGELNSGGSSAGFFLIPGLSREHAGKLCGFWLEKNNKPCLIACGDANQQLNFSMRSPAGQTLNVLDFLKRYGRELSLAGGGSADFTQGGLNPESADSSYFTRLQQQFEKYFTGQE